MKNHEASFRDPCGEIFTSEGTIYRRIDTRYKDTYDRLLSSGLYKHLTETGSLISHTETNGLGTDTSNTYKVIEPEPIKFISYPYEWCFSQLKKAALLTLEIQMTALKYKMCLKDASAYNIQFKHSEPVLIDTLSFDIYEEGSPWIAYRQFCQHFFAPLAMMSYGMTWANQLFTVYLDGIPLELASSVLPLRSHAKLSALLHIHAHSKSQRTFSKRRTGPVKGKMGLSSLLGLLDDLKSAIEKLRWEPKGTEWADYYGETNYTSSAFSNKINLVAGYLGKIAPGTVWDLGANTGEFSRIASGMGIHTVSADIDPAAVEINYLKCLKDSDKDLLPLLMDLTNPSPAIGWENRERTSFLDRGPADAVLALALVHHLAISNNLPLDRIALFFAKHCRHLIIEFIPKHDSQAQKLLSGREDIFGSYSKKDFEKEFAKMFNTLDSRPVEGSDRILYLMETMNK